MRVLYLAGRRALADGTLATAAAILARGRTLVSEPSRLAMDLDETRAEVEAPIEVTKRRVRGSCDRCLPMPMPSPLVGVGDSTRGDVHGSPTQDHDRLRWRCVAPRRRTTGR